MVNAVSREIDLKIDWIKDLIICFEYAVLTALNSYIFIKHIVPRETLIRNVKKRVFSSRYGIISFNYTYIYYVPRETGWY